MIAQFCKQGKTNLSVYLNHMKFMLCNSASVKVHTSKITAQGSLLSSFFPLPLLPVTDKQLENGVSTTAPPPRLPSTFESFLLSHFLTPLHSPQTPSFLAHCNLPSTPTTPWKLLSARLPMVLFLNLVDSDFVLCNIWHHRPLPPFGFDDTHSSWVCFLFLGSYICHFCRSFFLCPFIKCFCLIKLCSSPFLILGWVGEGGQRQAK